MGDKEKFLRRRHVSNPNINNAIATSSPLFYSIPWTPTDFSTAGLGPGQSCTFPHEFGSAINGYGNHPYGDSIHYSKSGFTYYRDSKCICGFLSEYRKQFNQQNLMSASPNYKPWWTGRELTSKFDPKYPCYPMHIDGMSTYSKDYRGIAGHPAPLCFPEGEIERATRNLTTSCSKRHSREFIY